MRNTPAIWQRRAEALLPLAEAALLLVKHASEPYAVRGPTGGYVINREDVERLVQRARAYVDAMTEEADEEAR